MTKELRNNNPSSAFIKYMYITFRITTCKIIVSQNGNQQIFWLESLNNNDLKWDTFFMWKKYGEKKQCKHSRTDKTWKTLSVYLQERQGMLLSGKALQRQ